MVRLLELLAVLDQRLKVVEGVVQDHEVAVLEVKRLLTKTKVSRLFRVSCSAKVSLILYVSVLRISCR